MFGHLMVYSAYSFQESTLLIKDIIQETINKNQKVIALTDQNNMYGMIEFYSLCKKNDIKPIIGLELSITIDQEAYPFVVVAKDVEGYYALCKYSTMIQTGSIVEIEEVAKMKYHLALLTPGNKGLIERLILKDLSQSALRYMSMLDDLMEGNFYINLQDHAIEMQKYTNEKLRSLAKILNIQVVCSNAVCYANIEDAFAIDLLQASKNDQKLDLQHHLLTDQRYFKSTQEMEALFDEEIISNTSRLIDCLNVEIPLGNMNLPQYPVPKNGSASDKYSPNNSFLSFSHSLFKARYINFKI